MGSAGAGWQAGKQAVANEAFQVRYGDRFFPFFSFLSSLKESAKKEIPAMASSFVIQSDSLKKGFGSATQNRKKE